jgi:membrane peptidoglycan carboxypeptidase
MIKKSFIVLGLILAGIFIYYTIVIVNARMKTPEIVHNALSSGRMKIELNDLSSDQLDALVRIQDPNFYYHKGFDFRTPGAGVTSISQGLVKMYYFDNFKPGLQKIKQTLIARFAFDPMTPKDTILKLFVNEVYLGQNDGQTIKGFENAANSYLNKSFKELTWDEYLSMVAMIRAPATYNYAKNLTANQDRVTKIKRMLKGEYLPIDNSDWLYDRR